MSDQLHQSSGMATWRLSPNACSSRNWPSSCRCSMVALSISETDECLLRSKCDGYQWIRPACHDLVSASGTVNFAHGSPSPDISLVDWRSPSGKESSFFTGLMSRLPGETGSDCLSQYTVGRVYQMCCMAWHRRTSLFGATASR